MGCILREINIWIYRRGREGCLMCAHVAGSARRVALKTNLDDIAHLDEIVGDALTQRLKLFSRREVQISDTGCGLRSSWRGAV
jgi:hypothetical protein